MYMYMNIIRSGGSKVIYQSDHNMLGKKVWEQQRVQGSPCTSVPTIFGVLIALSL